MRVSARANVGTFLTLLVRGVLRQKGLDGTIDRLDAGLVELHNVGPFLELLREDVEPAGEQDLVLRHHAEARLPTVQLVVHGHGEHDAVRRPTDDSTTGNEII